MDEAVYVRCASSASQSKAFQTLIPCMRAAAPTAKGQQTAKRSVTRVNDQANDDQKELDPNARLEKRIEIAADLIHDSQVRAVIV